MRKHVDDKFLLNVGYTKMKNVKRIILEKLDGSFIDDFNKLETYAQELRDTNPGSDVMINISNDALKQISALPLPEAHQLGILVSDLGYTFLVADACIHAGDVNNNISLGLINLSEDLEAFNIYPWGYESFKMTVKYLLTLLTPKIVKLYGFPWAFMAKYAGVINAINALTASIKEITSKRDVIPSKRISYPDTPLEIKEAKRRRKETSKASSIIKKIKIATPLSFSYTNVQYARATEEQHELKKVDVTATAKEHNITVDNPSTASKDEEKVEPVNL
ncbi:hypothetical protein BC332_02776 [Capsicum chinense]|nr:hypothetical protein BC332_02776 [Capsicum chinense]